MFTLVSRWPRPAAAALLVGMTSLPLLLSPARAQRSGPPSSQQVQQLVSGARKLFYAELGLTKAQITKLEAIKKKHTDLLAAKRAEIQKKYGDDWTTKKEARTAMSTFNTQNQEASMKAQMAIMTPAQQAKFKTYGQKPFTTLKKKQ